MEGGGGGGRGRVRGGAAASFSSPPPRRSPFPLLLCSSLEAFSPPLSTSPLSPLSSPGFGPNRWEREKDETVNGADRGRHFSPSLLFPNSIAPSILLLPPPPSPPFPFFSYRKFSCAKGQKKLLVGARSVFLFQQSLSRTKCWTFWRSAPGVPGVQGSGATTFNSAAKEDSDLFQDAELGVPLRRRRPCRPLRRRP